MAPRSKIRPPVLFLNVGWANYYQGAADDPAVGKFGYIRDGNEDPGEAINFRVYDGRCYGYAPVHGQSVNVKRLDSHPEAEFAAGVLVIWTATHPGQGGSYIVGWYRRARVWARMRHDRPDTGRPDFIAEAAAVDCHLVPTNDRTFWMPTKKAKGMPGQSSSFFASDTLSPNLLAKVLDYVDGRDPGSSGFAPPQEEAVDDDPSWRTRDPEMRARVEKAAEEVVCRHFEARGWKLKAVQKENLGWDIEATKVQGRLKLHIEVKGRGGSGAVELTPNEYVAMLASQRKAAERPYRLAVVHHALSDDPKLTVFEWAPHRGEWVGGKGEVLTLVPKTGAVAKFAASNVEAK